MKGKVFSALEKQGKNGAYLMVQMDEDGTVKKYLAKDPDTMKAVKAGGELEYNTSPTKDGDGAWMRLVGSTSSGGQKQEASGSSRGESFACSYAKDIAVAFINQGVLKQASEVDIVIDRYFTKFMSLLGGK